MKKGSALSTTTYTIVYKYTKGRSALLLALLTGKVTVWGPTIKVMDGCVWLYFFSYIWPCLALFEDKLEKYYTTDDKYFCWHVVLKNGTSIKDVIFFDGEGGLWFLTLMSFIGGVVRWIPLLIWGGKNFKIKKYAMELLNDGS